MNHSPASCTAVRLVSESIRRCHRVVATVLVGEGLLVRRMLTVQDRAAIAKGLKEGCSLRRTADRIGRSVSVVSREIRRNGGKCGYQPVTADVKAQKRRSRPKTRKIDADPVLKARVLADLKRSRTPRQIVGRLRVEACDGSLEPCKGSPSAEGAVVSHEAVYTRVLYPLPASRIWPVTGSCCARSAPDAGRVARWGSAPIRSWGWSALVDRPEEVDDRRAPRALGG